MKIRLILFYFLVFPLLVFSQKDSLSLGDRYAEDQIYLSVSYSQFNKQPSTITKSNFSYSLSTGFIKDFILNKKGTFSFAAGVGYGYDFFNHKLKVAELNGSTMFSNDNSISENVFKSHNLEVPLEIRWRTSTAKKYNFWRVYTGLKFSYNLSNKFQYLDANSIQFKYANVSAYNKLQYGLTISAGYDEFNINFFYGLTPIFNNGVINGEAIDTKILKFGLIFYFL
ncbi:porin family protein [Polaribacter sp. IC073]|uniref:porin family protein n=1 Tax=Polaribacter sp. IC073 TaxID=2508540 RepID=UPI0011BEBE23|nr:porin family protein [Polaribacter sp. IC073]TXD49645.1 PorT family protein [Polaribacter sp. IC073]